MGGGISANAIAPGIFWDLTSSNLNNDFEHQCFDIACQKLDASHLPVKEGDMGPYIFAIPGITRGQLGDHPHIWEKLCYNVE